MAGPHEPTVMGEVVDENLYRETVALLEPGEIALNGVIVHTDLETDAETRMHETTVEVGEVIAEHAGEGDNVYVHAGNDDPEFGMNQFQGLTLDGDDFVWECQQLLRNGTYDVVFYYEASADQEAILTDLREAGYRVTSVEVG